MRRKRLTAICCKFLWSTINREQSTEFTLEVSSISTVWRAFHYRKPSCVAISVNEVDKSFEGEVVCYS